LNQNLGEFEEINIKDSSQGHETSLILTSNKGKNMAINAEKSMNLRERIENNLTLWLLGVAVSSFIAGIGAYKGILEIAKLDTIQKGTYVEREQYDLLQKNFNELKSKFQLLNDTLSEIDIDKVNTNSTSRLSLPIKFFWEGQSNLVLQVYKQGSLIFSEEHSSPYVINSLPTGLSEIKLWIPGEATSFKSIWIEIMD